MSMDTRSETNSPHTTERTRSPSDELWRYVDPYIRWRWLLVACVVIGLVGTYIVTKLQPPVYRATAVLVVDTETAPASDEGAQLASTYAQLVTRPIILQQAAKLVDHVSAADLARRVQSSVESTTGLIDIMVDDTNPSSAATQANAVASAFTSVLATQGLGFKYPVIVFQPAIPPAAPDHPNPVRNALIGGALALVLAIALIHLLDLLETRPKPAVGPTEQVNERMHVGSANGMVKGSVDLQSAASVDTAVQSADGMSRGDGA